MGVNAYLVKMHIKLTGKNSNNSMVVSNLMKIKHFLNQIFCLTDR